MRVDFPESRKKILTLLADGGFHSGTELASRLQISRSAVWKQLHALSEFGLESSAVTGKGYRLNNPIELLEKIKINKALSTDVKSLISRLEIYDQIESTNNYLVKLAQERSASGIVCLAEYQSAGRGRRGRTWVSPFGSNIYLSVLWQFQNGPAAISGLSLAAGIAIIRALKKLYIKGIGLKWPNDIYWQEKKLGGILIEVSGETDGPCVAVIGIGLNVFISEQQALGIDQDWTDLTQIMGQSGFSRNELAASLLNELLPVIAHFENEKIQSYLDQWREYDCMYGKSVTLSLGEKTFTGVVMGVDDNGLLLLKQPDGVTQVFASGEVSFNRSS